MIPIDATDRPRLAPGCRLSKSNEQTMLAIPEGAIRLNPTALKVVQYCDGRRTFDEIVRLLRSDFPLDDAAQIERDAATLLESLRARRIVCLETNAA